MGSKWRFVVPVKSGRVFDTDIIEIKNAADKSSRMEVEMSVQKFFIYLAVMAGVTYLIRAVPFVLCQGKVENKYVKSFLAYVPYAVLGAMTFPAILYSTNGLVSGIAGTVTGLVLAYNRKSLLLVAVVSCAAAFLVEGLFC